MQWTSACVAFVLELERKINDHNQVDDDKKKECLRQAIVSLEMFQNLHLQKHGRTPPHKRHLEITLAKEHASRRSVDTAKETDRAVQ